ncbi:MAG: PAS domain S-box protein [Armatimonadota bacterium]
MSMMPENHPTDNASEINKSYRSFSFSDKDLIQHILHLPEWIKYSITIAIEAIITIFLIFIESYFPLGRYPIVYVLTIGAIAYFLGIGPSILAFVLGILAFGYYFNPLDGNQLPISTALAGWAAFVIGTSLVAISMIFLRREEQRTQEALIKTKHELSRQIILEDALRQAESNFHGIFNYTPAAIFAYDSQGIILQANTACEKLFNIPRDTMVGRTLFETVARSKDRLEIEERIKYVFSGNSVENIEWIDTRPDNSYRWIMTNVTPVRDSRGNVIMGLSLNIDITARKEAEQREKEQEAHKLEFYRRTIMAATDGKLIITEESEICNISGQKLVSWEIKDLLDLASIRHSVTEIAQTEGMDKSRIELFVLCIGETITNAYKHAGKGEASLHRLPDGLMLVVSDNGPGIPELNLPDLALTKGYSTAGTMGMGYKIMISYSDKVYLATGPEGTMVGLYMKFHEPAILSQISRFMQ